MQASGSLVQEVADAIAKAEKKTKASTFFSWPSFFEALEFAYHFWIRRM
jgi:hypothetical protein